MGVDFLAIKTADNQEDMYEFLKREGKIVLDKFNKQILKNKIKIMRSNPK